MTREEIDHALFALSGHDPQFRTIGLTGEVFAHIEMLEKAIRDAPHDRSCEATYLEPGDCNCWKHAALSPEGKEGR